jgi:hypothetical protein
MSHNPSWIHKKFKTRQAWEEAMLETGLFEWEHDKDGGKILHLTGTNLYLVSTKLWILGGDIRNKANERVDFTVINKFETIMDIVEEKVQESLLFHLDLFV